MKDYRNGSGQQPKISEKRRASEIRLSISCENLTVYQCVSNN